MLLGAWLSLQEQMLYVVGSVSGFVDPDIINQATKGYIPHIELLS